MVTITTGLPDTRNRPQQWRRDRWREALASQVRRGAAMVSAARHHNWSPALTIGGFAAVDTSAFQLAAGHISPGIGLLVTGISAWLYDWSRDQ